MGDVVHLPVRFTQQAARDWLGWSQGELAARAGVAKNTVYLFEAGQRTPTPNILAALRRAVESQGDQVVV